DAPAVAQKLERLLANSNDEHFRAACIVAALANYEKANLRECLLESLEGGNNDVMLFKLAQNAAAKQELKQATNAVKDQNALDIFKAKDIDLNLASQMEGTFGADWETRCSVTKALLKAMLPGIERTSQWTPQFIRRLQYDDRQLLNRCELFWLLYHPEVAKRLQQERWAKLSQKQKTFLAGIKSRYSPVWALLESGFLSLLDLNQHWSEDHPQLVEFHRQFKASKRLQMALGMYVGRSTPMHWWQRVLFRVGLNTKSEQRRVEGERMRFYAIDPKTWNDVERRAILEALPVRWSPYLDSSYPQADFELETQTESRLEDVTRPPNYLNQLGGVVTAPLQNPGEVPEAYTEDVRELGSWLQMAVSEGVETLKDIMAVIREYLSRVPQARHWIWRTLSQSLKRALAQLSPQDYRFLARKSL
ncbi:MAG: hypothetical protein ACRDEA_12585, partial [Microcystaceae cyanobacterium]